MSALGKSVELTLEQNKIELHPPASLQKSKLRYRNMIENKIEPYLLENKTYSKQDICNYFISKETTSIIINILNDTKEEYSEYISIKKILILVGIAKSRMRR